MNTKELSQLEGLLLKLQTEAIREDNTLLAKTCEGMLNLVGSKLLHAHKEQLDATQIVNRIERMLT